MNLEPRPPPGHRRQTQAPDYGYDYGYDYDYDYDYDYELQGGLPEAMTRLPDDDDPTLSYYIYIYIYIYRHRERDIERGRDYKVGSPWYELKRCPAARDW